MILRSLVVALLCVCASFAQITKPTLPQATVDTDLSHVSVTGKSITVSAGQDLQAAINSANLGDELVLQAGATFTGNFELPAKTGTGWLVIRSSAASALPVPGNRVAPSDAVNMPRIVAAGVSTAFHLQPKANHYRLIGLEITEQPKQSLNYGLIMAGDPNDTVASDLPSYITLDRCYVHGGVLSHIKFGWQMNGSYLALIDSYVSEFHGLGQDTQAITGYMGTGPMKISNNYLSGAGENVLFGGAWDAIVGTTTADVTFTGNYLYKPLSWLYNSLVPAPTSVSASAGTTGTLAAGTYYYSVIAEGTVGTLDSLPGQAQSSRSAEVTAALSPAGSITLTWSEANYGDATDTRHADHYTICRTQDAPGGNRTWTYFDFTPGSTGALAFVDNGSATPLSGFGEWARFWTVKNLFEIKNGVRWLVDSNVMENNWISAQNGFAVLLTPRNEMPNFMPGNHISDIAFSNNIVRHVAGGVNIGSEDDTSPSTYASQMIPTARLLFQNNLWEDISWVYGGGNGIFMQFGAGSYGLPGVQNMVMDHQTIFQTWSNAGLGPTDGTAGNRIGAFQFSNSILSNGPYGWHFNGLGSDWATIQAQFTSIDVHNNVWAAANPQYPTANMFPADLPSVGFVNFNGGSGGDYHLSINSPYKGKASDGTDPGANMDTLNAVIAMATGGQTAPVVVQPPPPPPTTSTDGSTSGSTPVSTPPASTPVVTAPAPPALPTVWFQLVNKNSGKCLTAQSNSTLKQYPCVLSNDAQAFTLIPSYDAQNNFAGYQILCKNKAGSFDVWTASTANGAAIGLYGFKGSPNELFTLTQDASGTFAIKAKNSGRCGDIGAFSTADGAQLQQWDCNGGSNQAWRLSVVGLQ